MHPAASRPEPKSEPGAQPTGVSHNRRQPTPERSSTVFVELNTRQNDGFKISLEWNRDTGQTRIVIHDVRTASHTMFGVPGAHAADAFRHPFSYAP
jgi:hypothetical protein